MMKSRIAAAIASTIACFNGRGRKFGLDEVEGPRSGRGIRMPVAFDTGMGNLDRNHIFGSLLGVPAPFLWHVYFNDFDDLGEFNGITDTASWDSHNAGTTPTFALADGDGGLALITNAAADDNHCFFQKKGESFKYEAGKPLLASARFKVSDATQSDFIFGLQITDTTPLDVTDGIFFQKDDGDASLDFHVEKNNTASDATAIATVANDTFLTVAFAYDGGSKIWYGVNGVALGSLALTNVPDDEELALTFGIQNGEAVAKTMTLDYIFAAKYMGRS